MDKVLKTLQTLHLLLVPLQMQMRLYFLDQPYSLNLHLRPFLGFILLSNFPIHSDSHYSSGRFTDDFTLTNLPLLEHADIGSDHLPYIPIVHSKEQEIRGDCGQ